MKKEFIKLAGILCAITFVAALLLAGVNKITAPKISAAAEEAAKKSMEQLIPADSYELKDGSKGVYEATKDGSLAGYCVKTTVSGFGGNVEMMVGLGLDGTVKGIDILSHSETAGLGAKADSDEFKNRFEGKYYELSVVKVPTENANEVQAITGATITSKAVAEGVKKAYDMAFNEGGSN